MLVISGQVKRETCMRALGITGLRQLGDQEADIIAMVSGITKYAAFIDDPHRSAITSNAPGTSPRPDAPAPAGSIFRSTCRPRTIDPADLRAYDPAEDRQAV